MVDLHATATAEAAFAMRPLTSSDELSYGLTASAQFMRLKFKSETQRQDFQNDCLSCHQIRNERTRRAEPVEYWQATVERMLSYAGNSDEQTIADYVELLSNAFDGKPYIVEQNNDVAPEVLRASIKE